MKKMKEIIIVDAKTHKADICKYEADLLAVGLFSDVKKPDKSSSQLNARLDGAIQRLVKLGDFKADKGTSTIIYTNGKIGGKRVLLVGLGQKKKASLDTVRKAAAVAANQAVTLKAETVGLALHQAFAGRFDLSKAAWAMAEGIYLGSYRYDEFVTKNENKRLDYLNAELVEPDPAKIKKLGKGLQAGVVIGKAHSYARTLANRPGNVINPAKLAEEARKSARELGGLSCTVFDQKQLAAKGMGGISAVGAGSQNKPRLIILKYTTASKTAANRPTVGLVGKAITFDSGGISIKPSAHMERMKFDKTGGIAVLATLRAAAELKLPVNVYGFIPAAENLPSGSSYRPGDIISTYSGKTVEVQSTDAEGRMILSDALAFAAEQKCNPIIDIATLTGACMVALGRYNAGLMGNDERLIKQLQAASKDSGEKVWPMPSGAEYLDEMKSKIADLKNTGSKWGGACTGAAFLGQFVGDARWAHIDIAGMDMVEKASAFSVEGSSGFGVRLLCSYLMNSAAGKTH